jgi:hypothetical protein
MTHWINPHTFRGDASGPGWQAVWGAHYVVPAVFLKVGAGEVAFQVGHWGAGLNWWKVPDAPT